MGDHRWRAEVSCCASRPSVLRRRGRGLRVAVTAGIAFAAIAIAGSARAQPTTRQAPTSASAEDRREAANHFREGERAFKAGDFAAAAEAFEKANRIAPHPSALYNAARAWQRAGERAKAANLYAKYGRDAPADAPDRERVATALQELAPSLGRIDVTGGDAGTIFVDGQSIESPSVFVNPGEHTVVGRVAGHDATRTIRAEAGDTVSVRLDIPERATAPAPPPPPASAPATAPRPASSTGPTRGAPATSKAAAAERHGWSPVIVVVGAGATAIGIVSTVWSGVDTLHARDTFTHQPTQQNLDAGRRKQARTNLFLGLTASVAVFTAVTAIWLVDWKGKAHTKVGIGPASIVASGSF